MDKEMEKRIEDTVLEILANSDMTQMTEFKVRKLASDKLNLDLSEPSRKMFVRRVVESFLQQQQQDSATASEHQREQLHDDDDDGDEEEEEEEEENNGGNDGKEYDDDGDLIICRLSEKRRVTIQDFRGKTLVSIREYYKKDGKFLPTSKGISLTTEQWASFKKNVPEIEKAIDKMESRLN